MQPVYALRKPQPKSRTRPGSLTPASPRHARARRAFPSGACRARGRVLHPGRVEGRPPALLVVPRELEVEALTGHPDGDVSDAGPGVEPGPKRPERAIVRRAGKPDEAE